MQNPRQSFPVHRFMVGRWVKHFQLGAVCSGGPFPFRRMKMVVSSVSIVEASKPSNIAATTMQGGYEFLHNRCTTF
jgi:hypothetical protein